MKCFTIQSGNEYVADVPKVITSSFYYGAAVRTVDDEDEAKHYKNKSTPKAWIKKNLAKVLPATDDAQAKVTSLSGSTNRWNMKRATETLTACLSLKGWMENAKVIELDKETPNFPCDLKLRFHHWHNGKGSNMRLQKETHSRYSCKACGVILKNIPYYHLPDGNSMKICVACLYLRQEAIKTAFEGLPEDFRNQFVNELVLGSM